MVGTVVKKKQRMAVMQGCDSRVTRLFFFFFLELLGICIFRYNLSSKC